MGARDGSGVRTAVRSDGKGSETANERVLYTEPRQHDTGVCEDLGERTAGRSAGKGSEATMSEFNAQNLANTTWASAKDQANAPPLAELAMAAKQRMSEFNALNLANVTWAFAKDQANAPMFTGLARAAKQRVRNSMHRTSPTRRGRLRRPGKRTAVRSAGKGSVAERERVQCTEFHQHDMGGREGSGERIAVRCAVMGSEAAN